MSNFDFSKSPQSTPGLPVVHVGENEIVSQSSNSFECYEFDSQYESLFNVEYKYNETISDYVSTFSGPSFYDKYNKIIPIWDSNLQRYTYSYIINPLDDYSAYDQSRKRRLLSRPRPESARCTVLVDGIPHCDFEDLYSHEINNVRNQQVSQKIRLIPFERYESSKSEDSFFKRTESNFNNFVEVTMKIRPQNLSDICENMLTENERRHNKAFTGIVYWRLVKRLFYMRYHRKFTWHEFRAFAYVLKRYNYHISIFEELAISCWNSMHAWKVQSPLYKWSSHPISFEEVSFVFRDNVSQSIAQKRVETQPESPSLQMQMEGLTDIFGIAGASKTVEDRMNDLKDIPEQIRTVINDVAGTNDKASDAIDKLMKMIEEKINGMDEYIHSTVDGMDKHMKDVIGDLKSQIKGKMDIASDWCTAFVWKLYNIISSILKGIFMVDSLIFSAIVDFVLIIFVSALPYWIQVCLYVFLLCKWFGLMFYDIWCGVKEFLTSTDWTKHNWAALFTSGVGDVDREKSRLYSRTYDRMAKLERITKEIPNEVRQESMEIEGIYDYSGYIATAMACVVGTAVTTKIPGRDLIEKCLRGCNIVFHTSRAIDSLPKHVERLTALLNWCISFFVKEKHPLEVFADELKEHKDAVLEWAAKVSEINTDDKRIELRYNEDLRERVFHLKGQADGFLKKFTTPETPPSLAGAVRMVYNHILHLNDLAQRVHSAAMDRVYPYSVCFTGDSGIGKSGIAKHYVNFIGDRENWPKGPIRMYSRMIVDKFWPHYCGQKSVYYDDWMQHHGGQAEEITVVETISMFANSPYLLNMAETDEKGRPFTSELVVLTTNNPYPRTTLINNREAFLRRRAELVYVKAKDEYYNRAQCKLDLKKVRNNTKVGNRFPHLRFFVLPSVAESITLPTGEGMTWEEWTAKSHELYKEHMENQNFFLNMAPEARYNMTEYHWIVQKLGKHLERDSVEHKWKVKKVQLTTDEYVQLSKLFCGCDDVYITKIHDELNKEYDNVIKDARDPFRECTIETPAEAMERAMKQLPKKSVADRIKEFFDKHPLLTGFLGVATTISLVAGLYFAFTGKKEDEYDMEPENKSYDTTQLRHVARPKTVVKHQPVRNMVKGQLQTGLSTMMQMQATSDPNALDLREAKVIPNLWNCELYRGSDRNMALNVLAIGGRVILAPFHLFVRGKIGDELKLVNAKGLTITEAFDPRKVRRYGQEDLCIYLMGARFPLAPHIKHLFVEECQVGNLSRFDGEIVTLPRGQPTVLRTEFKSCRHYGMSSTYGCDEEKFLVMDGFFHQAQTSKGDCGSPVLVYNRKIRGKICAIHVAGNVQEACAIVVTREILDELTNGIAMYDQILPEFDDTNPGVMVAEGNYTICGSVKPSLAVRLPDKSDIIPSLIHDKVYVHSSEPAILTRKDPRNTTGKSPLVNGLSKYAVPTKPFPLRTRKIVSDYMCKYYAQHLKPARKVGVLSVDNVINGMDIDRYDSIDMKTSSGWPYCKMKPAKARGKEWLFKGEPGSRKVDNEFLQKNIEDMLLCLANNTRAPNVWTHQTKDELRPLKKIYDCKTRLFTMGPVHETIVSNMFYKDFVVAYYNSFIKTYSAVGMDVFSPDWTRLKRRLCKHGCKGFDGDYGTFDGKLCPDCMMDCADQINFWYEYNGDEDEYVSFGRVNILFTKEMKKNARILLMDEFIHTFEIAMNAIHQKHQGNPSGNPLTVVINGMVNAMYLRMGFREIGLENKQQVEKPTTYDEKVDDIIYGDDNAVMSDDSTLQWFNACTFSDWLWRFGIEYTSADKSEVNIPYKNIDQIRFLKCGFRDADEHLFECVHPTIDPNTIQELTNWIRDCEDPVGAMYERLDDACTFAYHRGEEYYEVFCRKVNQALHQAGFPPMPSSFEAEEDVFLNKFY